MSSIEPDVGSPVSRPNPFRSFLKGRWYLLEALFLALALSMLVFGRSTPSRRIFSLLFSSIILEALPPPRSPCSTCIDRRSSSTVRRSLWSA